MEVLQYSLEQWALAEVIGSVSSIFGFYLEYSLDFVLIFLLKELSSYFPLKI